ncbi:MAG: hypothetical protein DI538_27495 [Azospira oryzae]|nr:MAG: hypothetical protein DI538_27495 [Azospira oryzae]
MLLEQRDVALQRFQQQEQEMQARRQQQPYYATGGYMPQTMPANMYNNQSRIKFITNIIKYLAAIYSVPYYNHPQQPYGQQPQGPVQQPAQYASGLILSIVVFIFICLYLSEFNLIIFQFLVSVAW